MKNKQKISKDEPYFVHIGYTFACEIRKTTLKLKGRYKKLPIKASRQKYLNKLQKYWRMSCK